MRRALDWLESRTGARTALRHLLYERLPAGTGVWFTLGGILLALLAVQVLTGAFLTLYYAPTPDHAYDSVRFITRDVAFGALVRGLHYYGASFLVVFAAVHLLRVFVTGSYKPPRELTWISGVALLLVVLAFALTGYLLPWDQRAYWATVVTIGIAQSTPLVGDGIAWLIRGGAEIGALTLARWYAAHVVFLPGVLALLVIGHLFLMRRHGISGPARPRAGLPRRFFPDHAALDVAAVLLVFVALFAFAWRGLPPLEEMADPSDAAYVPRPEWYFLGLFQLLRYFPGRFEILATIVVPGLAVAFLILLPWIDRSRDRLLRTRPIVGAAMLAGLAAVVVLTTLGLKDLPATRSPGGAPGVRVVAGGMWTAEAECARCHSETGVADPLARLGFTRGPDWLETHVADPEVIAPGVRPPPDIDERQVAAIVSYVRHLQANGAPVNAAPAIRAAAAVLAMHCLGCHKIDGDGGEEGPDLSAIGRARDRDWLRRWIAAPDSINPDAEMPSFGRRLSAAELDAVAGYLSGRR
jgi:ubiquinol-cytochrome c reductase cytochrome b subunit